MTTLSERAHDAVERHLQAGRVRPDQAAFFRKGCAASFEALNSFNRMMESAGPFPLSEQEMKIVRAFDITPEGFRQTLLEEYRAEKGGQ